MKYLKLTLFALIAAMGISLCACNNEDEEITPDITNPDDSEDNDDETNDEDDDGTTDDDLLSIYRKIYGASDIYLEGDFVVIKTDGTPDHKSPYYRNSPQYEEYNGTNPDWNQNPNVIAEFNFTFKIPLNPVKATNNAATRLGAIGVSLNGVAFFNQYAGPNNQPLTDEVNSFDQYNGHPTGTSMYHYHIEPLYLTATQGKDVLLGFLLDGFPVYGVTENGETVQNSDLDEFHGHTHATADYPDGIYHYHITDAAPYINGNGFYGTAGTVTQ